MFKPEAKPLGSNVSLLRDRTKCQATIFEGSGRVFLIDSFRRGIRGAIPGVDLLDGTLAVWRAMQEGNEKNAYRIYFPICAMVTLQMQAGLDGFLEIEKYLLVKRGIFKNTHRRKPINRQLDKETAAEIDRLFDKLQTALQECE